MCFLQLKLFNHLADYRRVRYMTYEKILIGRTSAGVHPASCTMGTGGLFPGGKARPGRDADHSPPSSAEVVNE
jgi:hypothetical protein